MHGKFCQEDIVVKSYQSNQPGSGSDQWSGDIHQHDCSRSVHYSPDHRYHPEKDKQ